MYFSNLQTVCTNIFIFLPHKCVLTLSFFFKSISSKQYLLYCCPKFPPFNISLFHWTLQSLLVPLSFLLHYQLGQKQCEQTRNIMSIKHHHLRWLQCSKMNVNIRKMFSSSLASLASLEGHRDAQRHQSYKDMMSLRYDVFDNQDTFLAKDSICFWETWHMQERRSEREDPGEEKKGSKSKGSKSSKTK